MARANFTKPTKRAALKRSGCLCEAIGELCAIDGCGRASRDNAGGTRVCHMHYQRWKRVGSFALPDARLSLDGVCLAPGCTRAVRSGNAAYCETHYYRLRRGSKAGLSPKASNCLQCGAGLRKNQSRYCSPNCSVRHSRGTPDVRICAECGSEFATSNSRAVCSDGCAAKRERKFRAISYARMMVDPRRHELLRSRELRRRARKAGVNSETFSALEIFERDNWTCQLCGKKVNRRAKWPHGQAPSIDHILPLALGGEHARINVQCTHLVCNLRKNKKALGQLRLLP